jgi:hypothetical protein
MGEVEKLRALLAEARECVMESVHGYSGSIGQSRTAKDPLSTTCRRDHEQT